MENFITIDQNEMEFSIDKLSWLDANEWTITNTKNLLVVKDTFDMIELIDYFTRNNLKGPYWVCFLYLTN